MDTIFKPYISGIKNLEKSEIHGQWICSEMIDDYVYAYSFGELLVLSLYAQYKKDPKSFVPKYLEFMGAGSTKTPQELLKPFGINLSDRKFWQGGMNIIKEMVAEAKLIYKNIDKR